MDAQIGGTVACAAGGGSGQPASLLVPPENSALRWLVYSKVMLNELPVLLRKEFVRRWDIAYPSNKWATLRALDRGRICWSGSDDCTVAIGARITRWEKGAAFVVDGEDLPNLLQGGDWVLVGGSNLQLVPKSNTAVSRTKVVFAPSKVVFALSKADMANYLSELKIQRQTIRHQYTSAQT